MNLFTSPPHRHVAECASTNDLARAWAQDPDDPAPLGAYVTADFQTQGRGRRGRRWQARPGESVLMSVVLRPLGPLSEAWELAFVAGLAVHDALAQAAVPAALKWPNDVLVQENKIAGILVETVGSGKTGWAAIVGIGVNINQTMFDPDASRAVSPISVRQVIGRDSSPGDWAQAIASALQTRLAERAATGWGTTLAAWRARMASSVTLRRGSEEATLLSVEEDGAARVRQPDGTFARWATVEAPEDTDGANRV